MFLFFIGILLFLFVRVVVFGLYVVDQNQRAVKTSFGRAKRLPQQAINMPTTANEDESVKYDYPLIEVIQPGGPYFKWPWEKVHKVVVAIDNVNMAWDPEDPKANNNNTSLDAITRDQLNVQVTGQLRYRISESNIYAYVFGVKNPVAHIMGYFISILRENISMFAGQDGAVKGDDHDASDQVQTSVSVNDLRKNLRTMNEIMENACKVSEARYGVVLEACLLTDIDPPDDVDNALAAINTAHNQVSSDISLAQASADQRVVQSKRAVEIETLKAASETEQLSQLVTQLRHLKQMGGKEALDAYVKNAKLTLMDQTKSIYRTE